MEFSQLHEPKSSSNEAGQLDQIDDGKSSVRSYGCVFCKRGFTTAQALGGHMNIHRKDRAKARPGLNPSFLSSPDENYASVSPYFPFANQPPHYYPIPESQMQNNPSSYFLSSTRGVRSSKGHDYGSGPYVPYTPHQYNNAPEEDWRSGLSLQVGPFHAEDSKGKGRAGSEEEGLDLELRLGHDH